MKARRFDSDLEELLSRTEDREAPPFLLPRIMAEIGDRQPSAALRLRRWWFRPQALSFSPARLFLTLAALLCAFWLGMVVGKMRIPGGSGGAPVLADSGEANFLIGRGLLAADRARQALPFLRRAVQQEPQAPEFAHWQGLAYAKLEEGEQERESYLISLRDKPDYLPSLLNLGHSYLEAGEYQLALAQYDKVLQVDPRQENALYNRALAYQMQGDPGRAERAYLAYLEEHRTGKWAVRALGHLHQLGNFTFRSYRVGNVGLILNEKALLAPESAECRQELHRLAVALTHAPAGELHLVAYHLGDQQAAKAAANGLQEQLTSILGQEHAIPIRGSWFDVAEMFTDANGVERQSAVGLLIFTNSKENPHQRNSI
jgi:tetratricopeptide (TPR) repeat protein